MYVIMETPGLTPKDIEINSTIYSPSEFLGEILSQWYIKKIERLTEKGYIRITMYYFNRENAFWWHYLVSPQIKWEEKLLDNFAEIINKAISQKEESVTIYFEDKVHTVRLFDIK